MYKIVDYSNATNGLDINENDNYTLYDISLVRNGQEAQPDKPVTVYIPIPEGYSQSSIMVYKQDQNGDWVFVEVMIYNGMIVFEVDHFCLFAIIEDSKDNYTEHTITFEPNGGTVSINVLSTNSDGKLASLPIATRDGYTFDGWYTDPVNGIEVTPSTVFTSDTTIYAHWTNDDSANLLEWLLFMINQRFDVTVETTAGGQVLLSDTEVKYDKDVTVTVVPDAGYAIGTVTVNGQAVNVIDNTVTIKNVRKDQKIAVSFQKTAWENPFTDVPADADYMEALAFVCENGLFEGESATAFAPGKTMTRAMFVTVLGRLADVPETYAGSTGFDDVADGMWYTPYVYWAQDNGIVEGHGNGLFGVDKEITVEQAAVILYRYAQYASISVESTLVLTEDGISNWAVDAMAWAIESDIYAGTDGKLNPQEPASRALIAQMLYNLCTAIDLAK